MKNKRIALISTPRSGNTWLRQIIAAAYGIPQDARHRISPDEIAALPEEVILQIHHLREPGFVKMLTDNGFTVVTLARHPLDVLLSILHVAVHDIESEHWLDGRDGDESSIWGAWPTHRAFLDYAVSPRAARLLSVTGDWWGLPEAVSLRYESLVADTAAELSRLTGTFGPFTCASLEQTITELSLNRLRSQAHNDHFWQGRPGLWRKLLPREVAEPIYAAHTQLFKDLGYICDPDPEFTREASEYLWLELTGRNLGLSLRRESQGHRDQMHQLQGEARTARTEAVELRRLMGEMELTERRKSQEYAEQILQLDTTARAAQTEAAELRNLTTGIKPLVRLFARLHKQASGIKAFLKERAAVLSWFFRSRR